MVIGFYEDLAKARVAEELVRAELQARLPHLKFTLTGDEHQHEGDIRVEDTEGNEWYIEVKDDSVIHKTRNVLCEDAVYYGDSGKTLPGNMHYNYQIYCVLSQEERKIYFLNFEVLKANYKRGFYKEMVHPGQTTYAYLCQLWLIKRWGGFLGSISY